MAEASREAAPIAGRLPIHHIAAESGLSVAGLHELLSSRDLFVLLVQREIRIRYRQTALGVIWVILQPLIPALIFAVIFGTLARLPSGETSYLLFALSGLVIFGLFSGAVTRASASFLADAHLITQVYFPRALIPLSGGTAALVDFLVGLGLLGVLGILVGHGVPLNVIALPVVVALALGLALCVGLVVAGLSAYYRDFAYALPFLIQVLLYASPIIYSAELIPAGLQPIYALNPLVFIVEGFRWSVLGAPAPDPWTIAAGLAVGVAVSAAGLLVFNRIERNLTDVI